jgi:DNA polymerase IV
VNGEPKPPRRIAHLDMDAFYASVELLRYPELRGLPVVVGGRRVKYADAFEKESSFARLRSYAGRGVVTTATYEARALGVRSGLGLMKAAALAPDAILLPADFESYGHYSRRFKAAVAEIAPVFEDRGIDEIYIDLSDVPEETAELAQRIKDAVHQATGLSSSIGVAPNKLLAKIASELQKPNGLTLLTHEDLPARIWPLSTSIINGVGPKASAKLDALGIRSIGDLAAAKATFLIQQFGKSYGAWLHEAAHGRDDRPVVTEREYKSISRETTFERDLHPKEDRETLSKLLLDLCAKLGSDLQRKACLAKTIGIKLRFDDFKTLTRDVTLDKATADPQEIREAARSCLRRVTFDRKLRLLGIRVASLISMEEASSISLEPSNHLVSEEQLPLFGE